MSIKLYVGLQGSGKSYEVVSVVILGAIRDGRRVVSNIAGLQYDVMREHLITDGCNPANLGTILQVTHDQIIEPNFFRTDRDDETKTETIVQGGDVVILDEIWRFWDKDSSVTPRHQNFFRMHRHMLNPDSGLSCEIVLISQDHMDVCRKIRAVVEKTYKMTKLTAMGLDKRYRVDIYSTAKFSASTDPLNSLQKSYNPEFFKFYKSHSAGGEVTDPKEQSIDKRGNIFSRPILKFGVPAALILFIPLVIFMYRFFNPAPKVEQAFPADSQIQPVQSNSIHTVKSQPEISDSWKVIGHFTHDGLLVFVIQNSTLNIRQLINPPNYQFLGSGSSVELPEGGFATSWANIKTQSGLLPSI